MQVLSRQPRYEGERSKGVGTAIRVLTFRLLRTRQPSLDDAQ